MANDLSASLEAANRRIQERRAAEAARAHAIVRERAAAVSALRHAYEELHRQAIALDHPALKPALDLLADAQRRVEETAPPRAQR